MYIYIYASIDCESPLGSNTIATRVTTKNVKAHQKKILEIYFWGVDNTIVVYLQGIKDFIKN